MSRRASVSGPRFADPEDDALGGGASGAAAAASGTTSLAGTATLSQSGGATTGAEKLPPKRVRTVARIRPLLSSEAKKIPEYHPVARPALITMSNADDNNDAEQDDGGMAEDRKAAMADTSLAAAAKAAFVAPDKGFGKELVLVMDPDKHFERKKGGAFAFARVLPASDLNQFEKPPVPSLPAATMHDVFAEVKPVIENMCNRVNSAVIVCGGPRSGKMTTMFGDLQGASNSASGAAVAAAGGGDANLGVLPRFAKEIFRAMSAVKPPNSEYRFEVEFVEVIGENTITDLLLPASQRKDAYPIKVKDEQGSSLVTLSGCTAVAVQDGPAMLSLIKAGLRNATRGKTSGTAASAATTYSHLVLNFRVTEKSDFEHPDDSTQAVTKVSKYWAQFALISSVPTAFVRCIDIAVQKSNPNLANDKATQALKVPVRDSTVTRITSEVYCGNCETVCIVCASPFYAHVKDSFNSLEAVAKFGRCRTRPTISHDSQTSTFRRLHDEMSGLSSQMQQTNAAHEVVQNELDDRQRRLEEAAAALEAQRTLQDAAERQYGANEIVKIVKALRLLRMRRAGDLERKAVEAELAKADDELRASLHNVEHIAGLNEELAQRIDALQEQQRDAERSKAAKEERADELRSLVGGASSGPVDPLKRIREEKAKEQEKQAAVAEALAAAKKENAALQKELEDLEAPRKRREAAEKRKADLAKEKAQLEADIEMLTLQVAQAEEKLKKPAGCSCVVQ